MTATITFREPLSGLEPFTEYDLSPLEGALGTYTLRATGRRQLRLFVVDAAQYLPEYAPQLGGDAPEGARILLIVTPHADTVTVNLLAPIVVDLAAGTAAQVIVADDLRAAAVPLRRTA